MCPLPSQGGALLLSRLAASWAGCCRIWLTPSEKARTFALCALQAQAAGISHARPSPYVHLLASLDRAAGRGIDACLDNLETLTEPHVARELARVLPKGMTHSGLVTSVQRGRNCVTSGVIVIACQLSNIVCAAQAMGCSWATACRSGTSTCMVLCPARLLPCQAAAAKGRCASHNMLIIFCD